MDKSERQNCTRRAWDEQSRLLLQRELWADRQDSSEHKSRCKCSVQCGPVMVIARQGAKQIAPQSLRAGRTYWHSVQHSWPVLKDTGRPDTVSLT